MQPNFSEAAFSMVEAGQIEGPVMTKYGAHYIRFVAKKESEPIPFERVKDDLMTSSKESTREKIRTELIDEFREEIASDLATIDYGALLERFLATKSATPQ
jgi:parvulin-like peptidyl-prolyl isomerase